MDHTASIDACEPLDLNEGEPPFVGRLGPCSVADVDAVHLPLWLTAEEAETLTLLCAASPNAAPGEERLFRKVGELLRAFRS